MSITNHSITMQLSHTTRSTTCSYMLYPDFTDFRQLEETIPNNLLPLLYPDFSDFRQLEEIIPNNLLPLCFTQISQTSYSFPKTLTTCSFTYISHTSQIKQLPLPEHLWFILTLSILEQSDHTKSWLAMDDTVNR